MQAYDHRARARAALAGNWPTAALVTFLAGLISAAGGGPSIEFKLNSDKPLQITVPEEVSRFFLEVLGVALPVVLMISMVLLLVRLVMGGVMDMGKARYHLNLMDGAEAQVADLFTGFPKFLQAMVMSLTRDILIFLGLCLLIVPGVLLMYGFAMAPYILTEESDCTGWEALQRSYDLMRGHRMELFWLELTFIGWHILAAFTFGIGQLFLTPYIDSARASFYREMTKGGRPKLEF